MNFMIPRNTEYTKRTFFMIQPIGAATETDLRVTMEAGA
jgi:hypothetical protein